MSGNVKEQHNLPHQISTRTLPDACFAGTSEGIPSFCSWQGALDSGGLK